MLDAGLSLPAERAHKAPRGAVARLPGRAAVAWLAAKGVTTFVELGPDADLSRLGGELWPSGTMQLTGGVSGWRQGAQRIDQRFGRISNGHAGQPYPSVTPDRPFAQRGILADAAASYLKYPVTLTARLEAARVKNPNNQLSATASYVRLQLTGRYAYRLP